MTDIENLKRGLELPDNPGTDRTLRALSGRDETLNLLKRDAIRATLLTHAAHPTPMKTINPLLLFLPVGALAALVLFLSVGRGALPGAPTPSGRQVAVAERNGFGDLPALTPSAGGREATGAFAAAPAAAKDRAAAAPTSLGMPVPGFAGKVEEMIVTQEGSADAIASAIGGGTAPSGSAIAEPVPMPPVRCLECDRSLPPHVVYEFTGTMPTIPAEVAVFRLRPAAVPGDAALAILRALGLGGFDGVTVQNLSFTEAGENPLTWTFDGYGGVLSFWRQGPVYALAEGAAGVSADAVTSERMIAPAPPSIPQPPSSNLQPPISDLSDADALAIARDFLAKHGVDASRYGAPTVQRQEDGYPCKGGPCPLPMESSGVATKDAAVQTAPAGDAAGTTMIARPEMYPPPYWWNPYVVVTYPALRDGAPVLAWDGSPQPGVTISINAATRLADNGTILLPLDADRSLYAARAADAIRADALRGGINPYWTDGGIYPPEDEKKRPVVRITLTTATFGYVEKYAEDGRTRYLLPVVGFRGTFKDQYGNVSPWGTIVPVLAGLPDRQAGAEGSAGAAGGGANATDVAVPPSAPLPAREE